MTFWYAYILAAIALAFPFAAQAQQTVDPRALTACQQDGAGFVSVNACLPDMHVAYMVFEAVGTTYGSAGEELSAQCLERNDGDMVPAMVCVREAISSALTLAGRLPEGAQINDPLFAALIDPVDFDQVQAVENQAKMLFPEKTFWGGTMYRPLQ